MRANEQNHGLHRPQVNVPNQTSQNSEIFLRQRELNLTIPKSAAIVGCGGIGSWVAYNLSLLGVEELFLIDDDVLEKHNLNRTPYRTVDVGYEKVIALSCLIADARPDCKTHPITTKLENISPLERDKINCCELIVDCRDRFSYLPFPNYVKLGYDGGDNITIHFNPSKDVGSVFGEGGNNYAVVPSWLIPPQLLSILLLMIIQYDDYKKRDDSIHTFNLRDITKMIFGDVEK